ncbi:multicopper oxidase-domain-containing protein [Diplogelasinospora grovesii]|uniref:laccase n=1 Tax=Diplogelasinospora grovesii TaxID=303347 RepID=A0AAN6S566_9PEZI|nr:multicopper oxidase-domain-containing protein [Diplogelasinospora grovesii]
MVINSFFWILLYSTLGLAFPPCQQPNQHLQQRQTCNTATNRQCWTNGFSINTDYETSTPFTGVTRTFTFTLTEVDNWVGGDGGTKTKAMLVNGQFPGPTITADWGDRINVTVINNLVTNGTSIHWHGVRNLNSNTQDGTPGLTECPIPPGSSKTYFFLATQYGTSWYHSHFSAQYANGVLGPIVINGPASSNYDIDLGPLMISDWYYGAADQILSRVNDPNHPYVPGFPGSPPPSDNVLFNGKNINPKGPGGSYQKMTLTPGKLHLLRLINPSVENTFTVSLVGHSFTVVATDFVPVQPAAVESLYIGVGQRYDVIINASRPVDNYWFNVSFSSGPCGLSNNPHPAAIFSYSGASDDSLPKAAGAAPPDTHCADALTYSPVVTRTASLASSFTPNAGNSLDTNIQISRDANVARVFWPVNNSPMHVSWNHPTLEYVKDKDTTAMPSSENVISVPQANTMTYWLVENNSSIPHPVHLHGHDVLVLGASPALTNPLARGNSLRVYNPSTDAATLRGNNPTRRDTTMLPAWGWLVVAFTTNNPGAWLFHCHVAWHVSQGLSVQFLEQLTKMPSVMDLSVLSGDCENWDAYYPAHDPFRQSDSGI